MAFIYENLNFIGKIDDIAISNYAAIYNLFEALDNVFLGIMSKMSDDFDQYIYLCVFLIKYINDLIKYITNNQLIFQDTNGILNDYSDIKQMLDTLELSDYYNSIMKLNIKIDQKPSLSGINGLDNLSNASVMFSVLIMQVKTLPEPEIEEIPIGEPTSSMGGKQMSKKHFKPNNFKLTKRKKLNKRVTKRRKQIRKKRFTKKH